MYITWYLEHGGEKVTNFSIAEAVVNYCNDEREFGKDFDAETVAKMILLQVDAKKRSDTE